jgi:hypothetical protein
MSTTRPSGTGRANALQREIVLEVEQTSTAPADVVYDVLVDLSTHLDWAGERQGKKTRLTSMEAPSGPASVGTEFRTTGRDPMGTFRDASVVTETTPPKVFEFVTEAKLGTKRGKTAEWTNVHRYELEPNGDGCTIRETFRVVGISELPGKLAIFKAPVLSSLAVKASKSLVKRGVRNLAQVAEERVQTRRRREEER